MPEYVLTLTQEDLALLNVALDMLPGIAVNGLRGKLSRQVQEQIAAAQQPKPAEDQP